MNRIPLTAGGAVAAAVGAVAYAAGWISGWQELFVVAAGSMIALLVALPFIIGKLRLKVERSFESDRVEVGQRVFGSLRIENPASSPSRRLIVDEKLGEQHFEVSVPALKSGETTESIYPLPTDRRGLFDVGPAVISRRDPLMLMHRKVPQTKVDKLWVRPRVAALRPLPVGFAKDLEGPTSDASPAGDVAFHTLREYMEGDDIRHIHWLSSARTTDLMVRHYVDNRRPSVLAIIDPRLDSYYDAEGFERAIEAAASVGVTAALNAQPYSLYVGVDCVIGSKHPGTSEDLLDRLCTVTPDDEVELADLVNDAIMAEHGASALLLLTGNLEPQELLEATFMAKRRCRIVVGRAVDSEHRSSAAIAPGLNVLDFEDLSGFVTSWNQVAR